MTQPAFLTATPLPPRTASPNAICRHPPARPSARASPRATIAAPMDPQPTLPDESLPETSAPWMPLPGVVHEINEPEQFDRLLQVASADNGVLVADFMATWCRKCLYLLPRLRKFAGQFPSVYYCSVNCNAVRRLPKEYNITNMPTFIFFRGGQRVHTLIGGAAPSVVVQSLRTKIEQLSQ